MPVVRKFEEQDNRFKELVLHISQKCANDPKFDTIKLNKLMFFADFLHYGNYGKPITGFEYVKLERGPAPKRMPEIKQQMEKENALAQQKLPHSQWRKPVSLRDPNLESFTGTEIAFVDQLIDACKDTDGDQLSLWSHGWACWKMSSLGETIPYELVFLSHEEPTPADIERGKAVARELGLLEQHT